MTIAKVTMVSTKMKQFKTIQFMLESQKIIY